MRSFCFFFFLFYVFSQRALGIRRCLVAALNRALVDSEATVKDMKVVVAHLSAFATNLKPRVAVEVGVFFF